jgi:hypothetical protein
MHSFSDYKMAFPATRWLVGVFLVGITIGHPRLGAVQSDASHAARTSNKSDSNGENDGPRSIGEFRKDLKVFMRNSKEDDPQLERNAIYNLCQLHREIVFDARYDSNQQLPGMRAVIAKRLELFSKDQKNQQLREARRIKASKRGAVNNAEPFVLAKQQHDSRDSVGSETGANEHPESDHSAAGETSDSDSDSDSWMNQSASESYYLLGTTGGGPNQMFNFVGRMGPPWDHGEELVDLIVNTINPAFWQRNGGPGSIHYYRPSRVLVVRAPQQSNDETADLLNRLRANGGEQINVGAGGAGN